MGDRRGEGEGVRGDGGGSREMTRKDEWKEDGSDL